jgi:hypothetical protein
MNTIITINGNNNILNLFVNSDNSRLSVHSITETNNNDNNNYLENNDNTETN